MLKLSHAPLTTSYCSNKLSVAFIRFKKKKKSNLLKQEKTKTKRNKTKHTISQISQSKQLLHPRGLPII